MTSPPDATPPAETIAIVGLGLIGGSFALALRRGGFTGKILGVSRPVSIDAARKLGAIDAGLPYERLAEAAQASDLVVLASPIAVIEEHLRRLGEAAERLRAGTVITDVGSTKRDLLRVAGEELPPGVHFVGGHPMAGSEQRGVEAADPFLFQNAYWVLTPAPGVPAEVTSRLAARVASTGARPVILTAEQHDRIAAAISHLPQLLAVQLVRSLEDLTENRDHAVHLAAGGFRDMTRIASSPFSLWRDILETNREEVTAALHRFRERLDDLAARFDPDRIEEDFARAGAIRAEIPRDTKGFLARLWDVLVEVEDTPGTIAALAGPLAEKGINVCDIEVLKVREGEGGTLRLAFASRELAREAVATLEAAGFSPRLRE